jgi:hypothetical protein
MRTVPELSLPFAMTAICCAIAGCHAGTHTPTAAAIAPPPVTDVYVDKECRVRQAGSSFHADAGVCHLESVSATSHTEEQQNAGVARQSRVDIAEQEFLLHDATTGPVIFVVQYPVAKGWSIDSDPQPAETHRGVAVFRVSAQPDQTVRLHVGKRHVEPIEAASSGIAAE